MSDLSTTASILSMAVFLALSGFFSLSESSLFSLGIHQREMLKRQHARVARHIERLLREPYKLIITILFADEVLNVAYSSTVALTLRQLLSGYPEHTLTVLSLLAASPTLLLLGEIGPKTLGVRRPRLASRLVAVPLSYFHTAVTPVRWLLMIVSVAIARLLGVRLTVARPPEPAGDEEIHSIVSLGSEQGVVTPTERHIVNGLFRLEELTAAEIMTPAIECFFLPADTTAREALPTVKERGFSRIPVYRDDRDNIVGILYAKDLLTAEVDNHTRIEQLARPPYFIPRTKKGLDLLTEFQTKKVHMAIVVDEYGRVDGLVTMEDILEELFGEFGDEMRDDKSPPVERDGHAFYIKGSMKIEEFNDGLLFSVLRSAGLSSLGEEIERSLIPVGQGNETMGGFLFNLFGRLPREGETMRYGNMLFTVTKVTGNRIDRIRVERVAGSGEEADVA